MRKAPSLTARDRALNTLLEHPHPMPATWQGQTVFRRLQDDTDGETGQAHQLTVALAPDGDWWLAVGPAHLRFRSDMGGGASPRVHAALMVLAEAMRRDAQVQEATRFQSSKRTQPQGKEPAE